MIDNLLNITHCLICNSLLEGGGCTAQRPMVLDHHFKIGQANISLDIGGYYTDYYFDKKKLAVFNRQLGPLSIIDFKFNLDSFDKNEFIKQIEMYIFYS
jgi:hypothetical protein